MENLNNVILVPTDFSEVCENAAFQAAKAAQNLEYKVVLLHVIDKNSPSGDEIEEKLEALAVKLVESYNITVDYVAKEGDIFTTIPEESKDLGASLLFLGTHGKSGLQKITGSFALKVITNSHCPTIVVHKREFAEGFKNIVLPITSDAGPWEKTQWTTFIAKTFGSKVDILIPHTEEAAVKETAEKIGDILKQNDVEFTITAAEKTGFTKQVIDHATSVNADLIMIMTKPDTNFTDFILGSYDEEIMFNTSQIPVMCINPRKSNYKIIGMM
jgi:nucleotide-binding universal stress UspA family protein